MQQTQNQWKKTKCLKKRRGFVSSVKGVSHLSRRAKRRLCCKLQLWMWRKQRENCRFGIFRGRRRLFLFNSSLSLKTQSQKNKKILNCHTPSMQNPEGGTLALVSPGGSENNFKERNGLPEWSESESSSETFAGSAGVQVTDTSVAAGGVSPATPISTEPLQRAETLVRCSEMNEKLCHTVKPLQHEESEQFQGPETQKLEVDAPSELPSSVPPVQNQTADRNAEERVDGAKTESSQTDVGLKLLARDIQEFLDHFYRMYGSLIPLRKSDVLRHLKRKFKSDFSDRKNIILSEVARYQTEITEKPVPSFRVVYKKHILTLEDLSTLADQNWLNDQVMNMYGELIMESSHHKVHFLNSFFHRQLMTKGYDGVKRWTKQVDLFSKNLLLVPIHLEVHWCLVTADIPTKKICLYDSQGNALQKVARNILKYLMTEAKEKRQSAFEDGWTVSYDEKIPQQTNENDCGVFVLEYSRCLALSRPFQFSQKDIPKIRTRIYKELCDCKLHEED